MNHRRARVDSCLNLIQDVHDRLSSEDVHPAIVEQLRRLDQLLSLIDERAVSDQDLERIESATSNLMSEIHTLFQHHEMGQLYQGAKQ